MALGIGPLGTHALGLPPSTADAAPPSAQMPLPHLTLLGGATGSGLGGTSSTGSSATGTLTVAYGAAQPMPLPQFTLLGGASSSGLALSGTSSTQAQPAGSALTVRAALAGTGSTSTSATGTTGTTLYPMPLPHLALLGGASSLPEAGVNEELTGAGVDPWWWRARAAALHEDGAKLAGSAATRSTADAAVLVVRADLAGTAVTSATGGPASTLTALTILSGDGVTLAQSSGTITVAVALNGTGDTASMAGATLTVPTIPLAGAGSTDALAIGTLNLGDPGVQLQGAGITPATAAAAPLEVRAALSGTADTSSQAPGAVLSSAPMAGTAITASHAVGTLTQGAIAAQLVGTSYTLSSTEPVALAVRVALQAISFAQSSARGTLTVYGAPPPPPPPLDYTRAPAGDGFDPLTTSIRTTRKRAKQIRFPR